MLFLDILIDILFQFFNFFNERLCVVTVFHRNMLK